MTRRHERAALVAILAVAAALRLLCPGADVPARLERTDAPIEDALWYLEAASGPAEGLPRDLEPLPRYDPAVWVQVARTWFAVAGVSLGSAQALGALVSLATLLVTWRWLRAALGPVAALVAAAVLATADPFAGLARTTLVYGPGTLALTCAAALAWAAGRPLPRGRAALEAAAWLALALAAFAALERAWPAHDLVQPAVMVRAATGACLVAALERWHVLRKTRPEVAYRLLLAGAAWAIAAGALLTLTPPVAAIAGGLALLHLARADRPGRVALALAGAAVLGGALLLADPAQSERLSRYLNPAALAPAELALRILRLGGEERGTSGTGLVPLAPGLWLAAAAGVALTARRWRALAPGRREGLALVAGWAGLWLLGAVVMEYRPLRYAVVIGPPLAALAGMAVADLLDARSVARGRARVVTATLCLLAALVATHALELLAGPRSPPDLRLAALGGVSVALALRSVVPHASPDLRRALGALVLAGAVFPGLVVGGLDLARATWLTRDANHAAKLALGPRASLVGPHASVLALGHGLTRRRAAWIDVSPPSVDATIVELRRIGATHVVLGLQQERTSGLRTALAARGVKTTLVGLFLPRGTPVLLLRLPWSGELGYELSPFEAREDAARSSTPAAETDRALLLTRVRTLAFQGAPEAAVAVARASSQTIAATNLAVAVQEAILHRGLR